MHACLYTAVQFMLSCYTNTTGNSIIGRTIFLFYEATEEFSPDFDCGLNDQDPLVSCVLMCDCVVLCVWDSEYT